MGKLRDSGQFRNSSRVTQLKTRGRIQTWVQRTNYYILSPQYGVVESIPVGWGKYPPFLEMKQHTGEFGVFCLLPSQEVQGEDSH